MKKYKNKTFNFYSDPGHGWLKVPNELAIALGLDRKITSYSYINNKYSSVYLEEDRDYLIFIAAYIETFNKMPKIKESISNRSSKIRNYFHYNHNYPEEKCTYDYNHAVEIYNNFKRKEV